MTLPPLPPAWDTGVFDDGTTAYTADDMHAYGEACAAAERTQLLAELLAEPPAEPVAWMHDGFVSTNFERVKHDESRNRASGFKAKPIIPLYSHQPQQRKPLTDRQAIALWADRSDGPANHEIISFARAIERAYGIGGTP